MYINKSKNIKRKIQCIKRVKFLFNQNKNSTNNDKNKTEYMNNIKATNCFDINYSNNSQVNFKDNNDINYATKNKDEKKINFLNKKRYRKNSKKNYHLDKNNIIDNYFTKTHINTNKNINNMTFCYNKNIIEDNKNNENDTISEKFNNSSQILAYKSFSLSESDTENLIKELEGKDKNYSMKQSNFFKRLYNK